jgi:hypothetical protein
LDAETIHKAKNNAISAFKTEFGPWCNFLIIMNSLIVMNCDEVKRKKITL